MPKAVSLIVLNHNRWADARRCLESVRRFTPPGLYELLAYDQASSDGTLAHLKSLARSWPQLRVVANGRNLTFAKAVNRGMREAQGRHVLWLNNDTVVSRGWLEGLLRAASPASVGASGPLTDNMAPPQQVARRAERGGGVEEAAFLGGFCFLLKRAALESAGCLDERFVWGWEDMDYCLRLRQAGFRLALAREVFVHHVGNRTISTMEREHRRETDIANRALIQSKWRWRAELQGLLHRLPATRWEGERPDASVIVLCRGDWESTRACLESVRRQKGPATVEILAAPFGSDRRRLRGLRELERAWPELKVLTTMTDTSWTHAANLALREARGEHLFVLSREATVAPAWVEESLRVAGSEPNIGVVGPDGEGPPSAGGTYRPVTHLRDGFLMVPRRVLERIGGFDDRFQGRGGAADYCLRARQAGYQVVEPSRPAMAATAPAEKGERGADSRLLFQKWAGHPLFPAPARS